MPRAHRWNPEAIAAVSKTKTASDDSKNQETTTTNPTVVFCPYAAKGSQNAAVAETRHNSTTTNEQNQEAETNSTSTSSVVQQQQKRNAQDIVTATVFWLVDQNINRVIGRLEKEGLVNVLDEFLNKNESTSAHLKPIHLKSHQEYRELILANLKTEGQRNFFISEFVENSALEKRKFGNMAVCHEDDVKCAHALVGQYFANVTCPLGELVAKFILFLGKKAEEDDENNNENGEEEESGDRSDWKENLIPLFKKFVLERFQLVTGKLDESQEKNKINTLDVSLFVDAAKRVLDSFVEKKGEGKGRRRKRRTD